MHVNLIQAIAQNTVIMVGDNRPLECNRFVSVQPHAPKRLSLFTIELTQQCNFRCSYCCFSGEYRERREHNSTQMSELTMREMVRFIVENRCKDRLTIVTFYGGEALLAIDKMKWVICKLRTCLGDNVGFSISSNGYLLTPKVVDWLCSVPNCHIYITIDGYEDLHDSNRKTIDNQPTYQKIVGNLRYFKEKYPLEYRERVFFLVTLKRWIDLVEVSDRWNKSRFFCDKIPTHLSFILPKNLEEIKNPVSSIEERELALKIAFDRYKSGEKSLLVNQFTEWTDSIARSKKMVSNGAETIIYTCVEDMYRVFITAKGDIFICERFCSNDCMVGNVIDGLNEEKIIGLENRFMEMKNKHCVGCNNVSICSFCFTALNYNEEELEEMCEMERKMGELMTRYYWKRRMWDRRKQLLKIENESK